MISIHSNEKTVSEVNISKVMFDMLNTFIERIGDQITIFGFEHSRDEEVIIEGINLGSGPILDPEPRKKSISFSMKDDSVNYIIIDTEIIESEPTFKIDDLNFYFHIESLCKGNIVEGKNE